MKKVIIAGTRTFDNYDLLEKTIDLFFGDEDIEIISGCAKGADQLGERYATEYGLKLTKFPADWDKYGKKAGYLRNKQMADYGNHLVAFWDNQSRGTKMMIDIARGQGLKTEVILYDPR